MTAAMSIVQTNASTLFAELKESINRLITQTYRLTGGRPNTKYRAFREELVLHWRRLDYRVIISTSVTETFGVLSLEIDVHSLVGSHRLNATYREALSMLLDGAFSVFGLTMVTMDTGYDGRETLLVTLKQER